MPPTTTATLNTGTFTFTEPNRSQGNEETAKHCAPKTKNEGEDAQKWRKKDYLKHKKNFLKEKEGAGAVLGF